jgi:hypothetical protein
MARYPYSFTSKDVLQPGARGGTFVNSGIPGHRTEDPRINRTNNHLEMNDHDVLNIKYGVDPRLPALFRYGWAYGYNQFIITKGRIVAVDPDLMVMDTDTMHFHNALTLANGGVDVKLVDREWVEATEEDLQINPQTGELVSPSNPNSVFRKANKPIGIIERNEYTRDSDAFNGMIPGPVRTDALIELPWFLLKEKAEGNPWGSCYGEIKPGMLVKSDLNGRVCLSPLSDPEQVAAMDMATYEKERQQVIGEVYSTDKSLLPEGAAKYAQWALDDRLNFEDINPFVWPNQARTGEDFVNNTPTMYQSDFTYPGYPYDRTMISNDLHMLASSRVGSYDPRFDEKHRLDRGIPGLTDGGNVITRAFGSTNGEADLLLEGKPHLTISHVNKLASAAEGIEIMMKLPDVDLVDAKVAIGDAEAVNIVSGAVVNGFEIKYVDLHKGLFSIKQVEDAAAKQELAVKVSYTKKGMAGVPTNLDWDGCVGVVRILLQK